jgi:hypothetical protein
MMGVFVVKIIVCIHDVLSSGCIDFIIIFPFILGIDDIEAYEPVL